MPEYDAIVIGAGQAGPSLAGRLAGAGMKVAMIERKLVRRHLRQYRLHADQDAGRQRLCGPYGAARRRISASSIAGAVSVDMKRVKARKDAVVGALARRPREWLRWKHGALHGLSAAMPGSCRRTRSRSAASGSTAEQIFINVGGRAIVPPMPGLDEVQLSDQHAR